MAEKTIRQVLRKALNGWKGLIADQDHKKSVLTRILLRIEVNISVRPAQNIALEEHALIQNLS